MPLTLVSETAALIPLLVKLFDQLPRPSAAWLSEIEQLADPHQIADLQAKLATLGRPDVAAGLDDRLRVVTRAQAPDLAGLPVVSARDLVLPVALTREEVEQAAQTALQLYAQAEKEEEAAKDAAKQAREGIKVKRSIAALNGRMVIERSEDRPVPVEARYDEVTDQVVVIRLDTGAVVERRAPSNTERKRIEDGRQAPLFGGAR
jgi:hypothetical protein